MLSFKDWILWERQRFSQQPIKDGGFDIVLCGQQGVGTDNCQVPAMLAELLDWPQATLVVKLESRRHHVQGRKRNRRRPRVLWRELCQPLSALRKV